MSQKSTPLRQGIIYIIMVIMFRNDNLAEAAREYTRAEKFTYLGKVKAVPHTQAADNPNL